MAGASSLKLQAGEHRVALIRRHWWFVVGPLCWLIPLLALLPLYALADYCLPGAGLAAYSGGVDVAILVVAALLVLKWLGRDVADWLATCWVLTNMRLIEQHGMAGVRRREAPLRSARPCEAVRDGAFARLLDFGDLVVEVEGRGSRFVLSRISRPRELEAAVQQLALEAQEEHRRLHGSGDERIQAALTRLFRGGNGEHNSPTIELEEITPLTVSAQRRLGGATILYATRRHPLVLVRRLLVGLCALAALWLVAWVWMSPVPLARALGLAAAGTAWLGWLILDWRARLYIVTPEYVVRLRGLFALGRSDQVIDLGAIRDVVACTAAISGRLLNTGSLVLDLRDAPPVTLRSVPDPDHLKRVIHGGIEAAHEHAVLAEQEHLAGGLSEWFEQYHRMNASP